MRCTRDDARARRGSGCTVLEQLAHAEEEGDVELALVEVLRAKEKQQLQFLWMTILVPPSPPDAESKQDASGVKEDTQCMIDGCFGMRQNGRGVAKTHALCKCDTRVDKRTIIM